MAALPKLKKRHCAFGFFLLALCLIIVLALWHQPGTMNLEIVSSDSNIQVSVSHTFGTNHVYFFRDALGKRVDSLLSQFMSRPRFALDWSTNIPSSVIWVRCTRPGISLNNRPISPWELFQGELSVAGGRVAPLKPLPLLSYADGFYVTGWLLSGDLKTNRQSLLRITSTNGNEIVTIRVP